MARKRSLSPRSTLSAKRLRTTSASHPARTTPLTLDARSLSDELFLSILVHLSPYDLSAVEQVDRHFLRLANDPVLWRNLFEHAHPAKAARLARRMDAGDSQSASSCVQSRAHAMPTRRIASLPSRARGDDRIDGQYHPPIDWKYLFRLETNWTFGHASLHSLVPATPPMSDPSPSSPPSAPTSSSLAAGDSRPSRPPDLLALCAPLVISASRRDYLGIPTLRISLASMHPSFSGQAIGSEVTGFQSAGLTQERTSGRVRGRVAVQDLSIDGAGWHSELADATGPLSLRVYVAYTTGSSSIFLLQLATSPHTALTPALKATEIHYRPSPTAPPLHPAVLSALHGPLLVTCSDHFLLSFYHVPLSSPVTLSTALRPFRTLKSHSSWLPAALSLAPAPSTRSNSPPEMRCSLAHAVPVYPDSWSVAIQEIDLVQTSTGWTMDSTRTLSALSALTTPEDAEAWGGVGIVRGRVSAIGLSERWVCVGTGDNEVMCWEIPQDRSAGRLRLGRSMMGAHWGEVGAVACHGDRCVTADSLGRILVWSLPSLFPDSPHYLPSATATEQSSSDTPSSSGYGTAPFAPTSALPSPPPTPHPSSHTPPSYVEVLPPPKPDGDERGEEHVLWVGLDEERILSLGAPRRDWARAGEVVGAAEEEAKAKIWSFDR